MLVCTEHFSLDFYVIEIVILVLLYINMHSGNHLVLYRYIFHYIQ